MAVLSGVEGLWKGREGREGEAREGKGREGKGREGKGRRGKGREGEGRKGDGGGKNDGESSGIYEQPLPPFPPFLLPFLPLPSPSPPCLSKYPIYVFSR